VAPTFTRVLAETYRQSPDKTALHLLFSREPDRSLSYAELLSGAAGTARALEQAGIQPGEVVILILPHGENLVYGFWGAVLHGAVPAIMPFLTEKLSPEHYRASLRSLFAITAPSAVITYAIFLEEVQAAVNNSQQEAVNPSQPEVKPEAVQAGSSIRAVLVAEEIQPQAQPDFSRLSGLQRQPQDTVLLQHSSGTTGLQKGVALSHQAVFNQLESYKQALRLDEDDVVVSWLPLYHDMGLIAGFILPILLRVPLVLLSPFDWVRAPYRLMQAVHQFRGTLSWLPNFAYNFCAQKIRDQHLDGVDLSSWRAVINCSEPMYLKSHALFLERFAPYGLRPEALATSYAMAENVFAVTQGGIDSPVSVDRISQPGFSREHVARPAQSGEAEMPMLSAGPPIAGVQVRILDKQRNVLPERQVGEIALRSHCMLTGYYNRPDLTEQAFHAGWYLTGDLGYLAEGEVYVTGRKKDLIIVGGKNIYPQDIEALVNEVPGVYPGRVSVFGVLNENSGTEDVVVVAEAETDDPAGWPAIAEQVRLAVNTGSDVVLRQVEIVERNWLIKTSSGKISRSANREKYLQLRAD
jgi:acyl-CoA synthetase (AMP-forming)/AMP-acid ligase II